MSGSFHGERHPVPSASLETLEFEGVCTRSERQGAGLDSVTMQPALSTTFMPAIHSTLPSSLPSAKVYVPDSGMRMKPVHSSANSSPPSKGVPSTPASAEGQRSAEPLPKRAQDCERRRGR